MENDNTINEDYCQRTYGISKEAVIDYMTNRSYQIWYEAAFSDMITDEVILEKQLQSIHNSLMGESKML